MNEILTSNLDLWTSALLPTSSAARGESGRQEAYGIKKLRELILELAVRGKLMPQDPNDEPAKLLLDRLAQDKARVLAEGVIGRTQRLPEIADEEKLFVLPESWEWVRLGDLGQIFNGNSISERVKEAKYTGIEGGLPFIATKDVGYGWQELNYSNGVAIPPGERNFKIAPKGAVLLCCEGGSAGKKCGITDQDICFGNKLYALAPYFGVDSHFLLANYLTPTFFAQFAAKMTGIIGGISLANFNQLLVALPPTNEQRRIVARVAELMTLCDELEQRQAHRLDAHQTLVETLLGILPNVTSPKELAEVWVRIACHFDALFSTEHSIDQLKQTVLQLAVMGKLVAQDPHDEPARVLVGAIREELECEASAGKGTRRKAVPDICGEDVPFSLPASWEWVRLGELGSTNIGLTYSPKDVAEQGIPVLRANSIQNGKLVLSDLIRVNMSVPERALLKEGDLLICARSGSRALVGKVAIVDRLEEEAAFGAFMAMFRSRLNAYLFYFISSPLFRKLIDDVETTTINQITQENLRSTIVPLPPLREQHRIVARVEELMALCNTIKARISESQTTQMDLADALVEQAIA